MTRLAARLARSALAALPLALLATGPLSAAEGGGGLPQLDTRTYPSQIFWLIVSFALLYWLLKTKAIPRIADILETRQDRIGADLDRAARLRADAEAALKKHDAILAEAQAKAQKRLREAQERVAAELARHQAELDADIAKRLRDAEARIGAAKSAALAEVATVAAEVVQAAARRLAGLEVGLDEARAAVERAMGAGAR
ncbi:MAG: ATP synthase subunit b [Geminicoccaceae bacterium]|jgi:F-type H+-transporting ATPase subunit b|nr:MAG: ATP synthase subunit b [Geminicoccaceae bacterium]